MTKAEQCKVIYAELVALHGDNHKAIRSVFIQRSIDEAGCTAAGAATYYANNKNRGGATGNTYVPAASRDPNYVPTPRGPETENHDTRQIYSAVQKNKSGEVAHVAGFMNPTDALAQAKKVRGVAVVGFPEIGATVSSLKCYCETSLDEGFVDHTKTFQLAS